MQKYNDILINGLDLYKKFTNEKFIIGFLNKLEETYYNKCGFIYVLFIDKNRFDFKWLIEILKIKSDNYKIVIFKTEDLSGKIINIENIKKVLIISENLSNFSKINSDIHWYDFVNIYSDKNKNEIKNNYDKKELLNIKRKIIKCKYNKFKYNLYLKILGLYKEENEIRGWFE